MDLILGIETSCDETAAAVVADGKDVLSSVVSSQIAKHAKYGGVVPELAAREHLSAIEPVVSEALSAANTPIEKISAVAVTNGPGLIPSLLIGLNFARGLAASRKFPLIGINHFNAHIYGAFLDGNIQELEKAENYPMLSLVVSGGHTALVVSQADGTVSLAGTTLDDAAGEALDKAAKILGLPYPGGPEIERAAKFGDPAKFAFPRSLTGTTGKPVAEKDRFNFSFSGVKTSLYYYCKNFAGGAIRDKLLADTAASYQEAIVDVLARKAFEAAAEFKAASVVLSGGVACNSSLRERFRKCAAASKLKLFIAPPKYCTDNAAMVAAIAWRRYKQGRFDNIGLDAFSRIESFEA